MTTSTSFIALPSIVQSASVAPASSKTGIRIELAFLSRSNQVWYKLQQGAKRALDLLTAGVGLILILPLLALIALWIKLDSSGPVFYKSRRIGRNYRPFDMYKFRTMGVDADSKREQLRQQANLQGELFKLKDDPRVTGVGKVLRALSLDELPQLLNVVKGDMSLVGPRPLPPDESQLFEEPYTLRFMVYPGITGAWQVMGRSKLLFEQLCRLEMEYVLHWNLWSDFKILLSTFPAVLASRGAY